MASGFFFNGRLTLTPTSQSAVDDSAEQPSAPTVGNTLALLGTCAGGAPNTPIHFSDPNQVAATLISGPLCDAAIKAFAVSAETNAPGDIVVLRVGEPTQATLVLNDAAGNPCILLTNNQYGPAAVPKVKVEPGTAASTLRVTVQLGQNYFTQDSIGGPVLTVNYAGLAASAQIYVNNGAVTLNAPAGNQVAGFDLTTVTDLSALADLINAVPGFTATVEPGNELLPVLDMLDGGLFDVKTAPFGVSATAAEVVAWLNGLGQSYVSGARVQALQTFMPAPVAWTYLAGATYPAVTVADWTTALGVLQGVDCQWVVPLSGDPAIHAATDAHCSFMSTEGKMERRALCGPNAGTSLAAVMALPLALDSDRTSLCWPGYYDYDAAGVLTLYAPWMTAALVGAGFAGLSPGQAMTNKSLKVRGLEAQVRNPTDTDVLIRSGVLCLNQDATGYKVVRSISTWLENDNYNRVEVSCGAATDFVVRNVREAVDPLRGGEAAPIAISRAITQAETCLMQMATPAPNGPGVIVGDANSPAFRNITASLTGDTLLVNYQCSPVVPLNFIGSTAHIVPYSGTATAAAAST